MTCNLRWWYQYVSPVNAKPKSEAVRRGEEIHKQVEQAIKTGTLPAIKKEG